MTLVSHLLGGVPTNYIVRPPLTRLWPSPCDSLAKSTLPSSIFLRLESKSLLLSSHVFVTVKQNKGTVHTLYILEHQSLEIIVFEYSYSRKSDPIFLSTKN